MLSTKKRFLFVHIPKTGGNSIQDALRNHSDDYFSSTEPHQDGLERFEIRSHIYNTKKHSSLFEYRDEYGDEFFNNLRKFTCIRNPWDRALSFYFSPHRGDIEWDAESFYEFARTVSPVKSYISLEKERNDALESALNNINKIIFFEQIDEGFASVCNAFGLGRIPLAHRNRSARECYRKYYDHRSKKLVADIFREEISLFNYSY
jgi:hypothetical protein